MSIRIVLAASAIAVLWVSAPLARADEASKEKVLSELIEVMQYGKMADQMSDLTGNQIISHRAGARQFCETYAAARSSQ